MYCSVPGIKVNVNIKVMTMLCKMTELLAIRDFAIPLTYRGINPFNISDSVRLLRQGSVANQCAGQIYAILDLQDFCTNMLNTMCY